MPHHLHDTDWQSIHREVVKSVNNLRKVRRERGARKDVPRLEQQLHLPRSAVEQTAYLHKLVETYFTAGQFGEAEKLLVKIIPNHMNDVVLRRAHAMCALELGEMHLAKRRYAKLRTDFIERYPPGDVKDAAERDYKAYRNTLFDRRELVEESEALRNRMPDHPTTYIVLAMQALIEEQLTHQGSAKPYGEVLNGLLNKCPPSGLALAVASDILAYMANKDDQIPGLAVLHDRFKPVFEKRVQQMALKHGVEPQPGHIKLPESISATACQRRMLGYMELLRKPAIYHEEGTRQP